MSATVPPLSQNPHCNALCRACHYKDLDYPSQLERKTIWAEKQLGRWTERLRTVLSAPASERLAYRSKTWLRTSLVDGEVSFGMFRSRYAQDSRKWEDEFICWDTCPLHVEAIQAMIPKLKSALSGTPHREFLEKSLVGIWMGSPHLVVVSKTLLAADFETMRQLPWRDILVPPFENAWFHLNSQVGRKIFGHREIQLMTPRTSSSETHPIRAFRQVAQSLLTQARARATQALLESSPDFVLDLYCGTGELSLLLPEKTGWLGIELSSEAVSFASRLREAEPTMHAAFVGTVEHRLRDPQVLKKIAAGGKYSVYLNPPRSGLSEETHAALLSLLQSNPPARMVYLSCSASSLSRDLAVFEESGYSVELLQPYDFFPQTEHFETLAILNQRPAPAFS